MRGQRNRPEVISRMIISTAGSLPRGNYRNVINM
jgi:hypothetical protein